MPPFGGAVLLPPKAKKKISAPALPPPAPSASTQQRGWSVLRKPTATPSTSSQREWSVLGQTSEKGEAESQVASAKSKPSSWSSTGVRVPPSLAEILAAEEAEAHFMAAEEAEARQKATDRERAASNHESEPAYRAKLEHSGSTEAAEKREAASQVERYKTVLCTTWASNGDCPYGRKCQFAHGKEELRARNSIAVANRTSMAPPGPSVVGAPHTGASPPAEGKPASWSNISQGASAKSEAPSWSSTEVRMPQTSLAEILAAEEAEAEAHEKAADRERAASAKVEVQRSPVESLEQNSLAERRSGDEWSREPEDEEMSRKLTRLLSEAAGQADALAVFVDHESNFNLWHLLTLWNTVSHATRRDRHKEAWVAAHAQALASILRKTTSLASEEDERGQRALWRLPGPIAWTFRNGGSAPPPTRVYRLAFAPPASL